MAIDCPHCGAWIPVVTGPQCPECEKTLTDPPSEDSAARRRAQVPNEDANPFVWYASEVKINSMFKLRMFDDRERGYGVISRPFRSRHDPFDFPP
jgi:hypothetical protein